MSTVQLVKQVKLGDLHPTNRPVKTGAKETKQDYVQSWLDTFFKSIADIMPDSNGRESQHLPEWMTYKWITRESTSLLLYATPAIDRVYSCFFVLCTPYSPVLFVWNLDSQAF